jgi:hypothetical protein
MREKGMTMRRLACGLMTMVVGAVRSCSNATCTWTRTRTVVHGIRDGRQDDVVLVSSEAMTWCKWADLGGQGACGRGQRRLL